MEYIVESIIKISILLSEPNVYNGQFINNPVWYIMQNLDKQPVWQECEVEM